MLLLLHLILPTIYSLFFFFTFPNKLDFVKFLLGVNLGFLLFFIDRILHIFFIEPETEFSQTMRAVWKEKKYRQFFKFLITSTNLQRRLVTRSAFFFVAYVATAIFMLTSTGSVIGAGIILGIGLHFCFDFLLYRRDMQKFHEHFLWQIKRQFADTEVNAIVGAFCAFFILLSFLVIK